MGLWLHLLQEEFPFHLQIHRGLEEQSPGVVDVLEEWGLIRHDSSGADDIPLTDRLFKRSTSEAVGEKKPEA